MIVNKPAITINILNRFRLKLLIQAKRLYVIQVICFSILVLFGIVVVSVISYQFYITFQLDAVRKQISSEVVTLRKLEEFEKRYVNFQTKADELLVISQTLQEHQSLVEEVFELLPNGVLVKSFKIDDLGEIYFLASASDPGVLHSFFSSLEGKQNDAQVRVSKAEITEVSVNEEGLYSFGIKLKLDLI